MKNRFAALLAMLLLNATGAAATASDPPVVVAQTQAATSVPSAVQAIDPATLAKWGVIGQLAGTSWQFGAEGFATYRWATPGRALIGTVRTWSGTYQTVYVLNDDGSLTGGRKLTETGDTVDVAITASTDRFAVTGGNLRYSCQLRKQALACTDEVSNDGKRWAVRQALTGAAVSADQIAQMASKIPTGFPDWKPGTFDPQMGSFDKLVQQTWLAADNSEEHEFRFETPIYFGLKYVSIASFDFVGNPIKYFSIEGNNSGPLKSVLNTTIDAKHPAWDVAPAVGLPSSFGDSTLLVDRNLWRFSISPNKQFALLEVYNGSARDLKRIKYRRIFSASVVPEAERVRWLSVAQMFGNLYRDYFDSKMAVRWLSPGKVLVTNYFQKFHKDYRSSYCIIDLKNSRVISGQVNCDGLSADGVARHDIIRDVTSSGFSWSGTAYTAQNRAEGLSFFGSAPTEYFVPDSWTVLASKKIDHDRELIKAEAYNAYKENELRQQADMQTLYNSLSLLANRSMANAGMTSTVFDQARTDWSASGAPAPLPYDAGGVYGQRTADGGYYVSNGLSSKEVAAFEDRERAGSDAPKPQRRATSVAINAPEEESRPSPPIKIRITANLADPYMFLLKTGELVPTDGFCYSNMFKIERPAWWSSKTDAKINQLMTDLRHRLLIVAAAIYGSSLYWYRGKTTLETRDSTPSIPTLLAMELRLICHKCIDGPQGALSVETTNSGLGNCGILVAICKRLKLARFVHRCYTALDPNAKRPSFDWCAC